jgi:hypothetical protein
MGTSCIGYREGRETAKPAALPQGQAVWRDEVRPGRNPTFRSEAAVWREVHPKRQQFTTRRPIRPENASAPAAASNPRELAASGEARFDCAL